MAGKDKVYIDIIVDDNGTTQRVAVDSKKLGLALDDVEAAHKKTGKSTKDADRNLKGLSRQSSNTTKNFSKMAQGMTGTLVPAYAILASNVFAITAAFQFLKKAADYRVIQDSQVAFAGATGVGMKSLTADIQAASGAMLDFKTASEAASIGIASGLGQGQITELAEGAGNLSKILGRDVTDSFNRLIRGVTKAEPELLDELGITLRLADAQTNYAATLGKSAKDLSNYEKKQAVFAEVQGQLEDKFNSVADATDVQANKLARLGIEFEKVMKPLKEWINKISEPASEFFIKNIGSLTAALALLAIPIIKAIIPGTQEWAKASQEAADDASQAYTEAREEMEKLEKQQKDLERTGGASTVKDAKPGSGVDILAKGGEEALKADKYSKNRITLMLAHAKQGNGAIRKMDKRTGRMYILTLKKMERGHATTMEKIEMGFWKLTQRAELVAKKIGLAFKKAFAGAKAAAAMFVKGVDKVMAAAGWIGMLMMAYDLMKEGAKMLGLWRPNRKIAELRTMFEDLSEKLKNTNEEFKKFAGIQEEIAAAQERSGKADPLRLLQAQGQYLSSTSKTLLEVARQRSAFESGELTKGVVAMQEEVAEIKKKVDAKKELLKVEKEARMEGARAADGMIGGVPGAAGAARFIGDLLFPDKEIGALKKTIKELESSETKLETAKKDLKVEIKEATANQKIAAKQVLGYLDTFKGGMTKAMIDYRSILESLAEGDILSDSKLKDLARLEKIFEEQAKQAAFAQEQNKELHTSYNSLIAGITTYKTSVTDLSAKIKDQKDIYDVIIKQNKQQFTQKQLDWFTEEIGKLEDKERVLKRIKELEIGLATKRLQLQISFTKALAGSTPLQKKDLGIQQKLMENDLKRLEINEHLKLAMDTEKQDLDKIANYEMQLLLLEAQAEALERQMNFASILADTAAANLETGIQGGLSGVLKGEKSVKEAVLGIAKGVAEGALDNFATDWTKKIMQGLGIETQEAKRIRLQEEAQERAAKRIAKAHEDGGAVVAKEIEKGGKAAAKAIKDAEKGTGAAGQSVNTMTVNATTVYVNGTVAGGGGSGGAGGAGGKPGLKTTWLQPMTKEEFEANKNKKFDWEKTADSLEEIEVLGKKIEGLPSSKSGGLDDMSGLDSHVAKSSLLYGGDDKTGQKSTTDTIGGIFSKFGTKMKGLFSGDAPFLSKLGGMFGKEGLIGDFTQMFSKVKTDFGGLFQGLLSGIGGMLHGMVGGGSGSGWFNALLTGAFAFAGAGGFAGGGGGFGGTPGASAVRTTDFSNVAKSGLYPPLGYATGGIARGPRSGYPALLHGSEAVVPLPNGKDIPVSLKGAGASNNVGMTINITRDDSDSTVESDTQEAQLLGERLKMAVQQVLLDEKRAGGMLSPYGTA